MATKKDYYEVLGIQKTASTDEIKSAYRKLALQFHPDRNKDPAAEGRFKEISEAYAVLSDEGKRKTYDQYGPDAFSQHYSQEDIFRGTDFESLFKNSGFWEDDLGSFGPMFASFFGNGGMRRGPEAGRNLQYNMDITLEEAFRGTQKDVALRRDKICDRCNGKKAEPGSSTRTCLSCNGTGQVKHVKRAGYTQFVTVAACRQCGGTGKTVDKPCTKCEGSGIIETDETLTVKVPKGAYDGLALRLLGEGEASPDGGSTGDLYVMLSISEHPVFKRNEDDLHIDKQISFSTAALGGKIIVPTIDGGEADVKIPAGTQTGTKFRLRGMGMTQLGERDRGDEIVRVIVETPTNLSERQKELLKELEGGESSAKPAKKRKKGLLDKMFG